MKKLNLADVTEKPADHIATMQIHYPTLKGNVQAGVDAIEKALHAVGNNKAIRFLIIRFDDPNLNDGQGLHNYYPEPLDVRVISKWEKILSYIERLDKVTMAVLPPHVNDATLQIALVTDFNYCTPDTQFKLSAIQSGALPGMAEFRLAKQVGLGKAKALLFTGKAFAAEMAVSLGLVTETGPNPDKLLAEQIKRMDSHHVLTIHCARRLLNESYANTYDDEIGDYLAAQTKIDQDLNGKENTQQ